MATSLLFYHDAALTQEVSSLNPFNTLQKTDGSLPPVDRQFWLGSNAVNTKFRTLVNPGVNHITLTPVDTNAGVGNPATTMKLAFSQLGLDVAVGGDPLDVGVEILSGVGNAVMLWARQVDTTHVVGDYTDIVVDTPDLEEVPV
jgi:hypothetical protein